MTTIEKLVNDAYAAEVAAIAETLLGAAQGTDWSADVYFTNILASISAHQTLLAEALKRAKTMSDMEALNNTRNTHLRAIYYLNNGYLHFPTNTVQAAAHTVNAIFEKYGLKIISENYAQESGDIEALLTDLATSNATAAIAQLQGLSDCIAQLTASQKTFTNQYIAYEEAKAIEKNYATATTLKSKILGLINDDLVVYLRAMQRAVPATYGTYAAAVAQIIADNNIKVKKRRKKVQ